MIHLTIDNRDIEVRQTMTVLEAARANGISIPTLCYHEAVAPYAACRLCMVEINTPRGGKPGPDRPGRIVAACAQPCEQGLTVQTNSPRVQAARRVTAELLMASGEHLPLVQAIARAMGAEHAATTLPPNDCILCGLCVRACDELVGAHAISLVERGLDKKIAPPFEITSAACIACATCVLICPTGAIMLKDIAPSLPHPQPLAHEARGDKSPPQPLAHEARGVKSPPQPLSHEARGDKSPPQPLSHEARGDKSPPQLLPYEERGVKSPPSFVGKGAGGLGSHDARTCRVCGEATLPRVFADAEYLLNLPIERDQKAEVQAL
ncbi:MAG: (2Fe-2S)-binding protein [Chloroflexi bacterium]|nr:(2Fe-2S)-binding protein [Chloroflexota bacterium]